MNTLQRVLDGIGRRFIAWGTVLRQVDAAAPLREMAPFEARRQSLDRLAHTPREAWRSGASLQGPGLRRPESARMPAPSAWSRVGEPRHTLPTAARSWGTAWRDEPDPSALLPRRIGRFERFFRGARGADERGPRTPWFDVLRRLRRRVPVPSPVAGPERSVRPARAALQPVAPEPARPAPEFPWPPAATPPGPPESWWPAASRPGRAGGAGPGMPDAREVRGNVADEPVTAPLRYDYASSRRSALPGATASHDDFERD